MAATFEDVDYEDYMDIVTTYGCKFCAFNSNSPIVLKCHIRDTHVQRSVEQHKDDHSSPVSSMGLAIPLNNSSDNEVNQSFSKQVSLPIVHSNPDTVSMKIANGALFVDNTPQTEFINSQGDIHVNTAPYLQQTQIFHASFSNSELQSELVSANRQNVNQPSLALVDNSAGNHDSETVSESNNVADNTQAAFSSETVQVIKQQLIGVEGDQSSIVQVIVGADDEERFLRPDDDQSVADETDDNVDSNSNSLALSDSVETLQNNLHVTNFQNETVKTTMQIKYETEGQHNICENENPELYVGATELENDGDTKSRELFLCGNCSIGFDNIQDCKNHMIEDHGANCIDDAPLEGLASNKTDAFTQMEPKKKVGRKRKSEKPVRREPEPTPQFSDSDEDWTGKIPEYSTRSRRKCRPPSMLRHDYYLGKNTKKPRKHVDIGYNVKCPVKGCTAKFQKQETLTMHEECHLAEAQSQEPNFKCLKCTETFFFWRQARHHMWKIHKVDFDLLTCGQCNNFKTDTYSKLKNYHQNCPYLLPCILCGYVEQIHQEIHSSERPYTCQLCGQSFKQLAQLKNHQASVHGDSDKWLGDVPEDDSDKWYTPKKCSTCGREYANAKCLKKHEEAVHGTVKPFACSYCDHMCSRKAMLVLHLRTHTQEKPFKCDSCSFETGDHNSLRRHKMRHSGHKPYQCAFCPYKCIQAISFKLHMRNKHPMVGGGGVFNCNMCTFRTVNKLQYENHLNDHKNGLVKAVDVIEVKKGNKTKAQPTLGGEINKFIPSKQDYMTVSLVPTTMSYLSSELMPMESSEFPQVIEVPVCEVIKSENGINVDDQVTQIAIQTVGSQVDTISVEELSKLKSYEDLGQSDVAAAQILYSTLSAISQNQSGILIQDGGTVQPGHMGTAIEMVDEEGMTITLHLAEGEELALGTATEDQTDVVNV